MASQVTLKALGLNYSPNNLALPEGSLIAANDVIIRRDNVVESRRGFREYSETFGTSADHSKQLISYKDRILNHFASTLQYSTDTQNADGKEIFNDFDGTYEELNDDGFPIRIKSIEANKNLYFTTTEGIKKISARTGADFTTDAGFIRDAGAVKAIDFTASLDIKQGEQSGFLGFDSAVAYRILWGYKDLNDNLILGAPSDSVSVYNYLSNVCALDINALCLALDKLQRNEASYYSVIHNIANNAAQDEEFPLSDTFSDKFYTSTTDTAEKMRTNVVNIAKYIDRYGRIADTSPASYDKPLEISTIEVSNNEAIIKFNPNIASVFSSGFNAPYGMAKDSSGNIFVADTGNHVIKKVDTSGTATVFAGSGVAGNTDGTGVAATFDSPRCIVIDSSDNLYVVDSANHNVRKITSAGVVTTFAGSNAAVPVSGDVDATGTAARFNGPYGICLDPYGNFYVTDTGNRKIKKIDAGAVVTTIAGSGAAGGVNGTGINASFNTPIGITTDGSSLFVSDSVNCNIRKITISGFVVSTFAGYSVAAKEKTKLAINNPATYFNVEGTAKYFVLSTPNPTTKHCFYYEYDATKQTAPTGIGTLHKIIITGLTTANQVATATQTAIAALASDFTATVSSNEVTVTNVSNGTVNDADAGTSGITCTVIEQGSDASSGSVSGNDDGVGVAAKFNGPTGLYIDDQKIIYVSDTGNNSVRKVSSTAVVDTLLPINSSYVTFALNAPTSTILNSSGNLFIVESGNNRLDKLSATSPKTVFTVGDKIELLGADAPFDVLNSDKIDQVRKYYTLTNVTDNTIVFSYENDDIPASIPSSDTDIYSYDFRYIVETVQYDITSSNNVALSTSLSAMVIPEAPTQDIYANIISNVYYIMFKLKSKTNATLTNYISQSLQDMYLKNLNVTSAGSVDLTINVPQIIRGSTDYFLQIYRTAVFTATDGQTLGIDVVPDEEMNLVEEVLIDGDTSATIFRNDSYPDDLRGFNTPLYTNPTTGEGALQANEQPPIAKDLNRFKNVVFYANTKTKQRFTGLTLLGTSGIQGGDKIIIANSTKSNEYEFVLGEFEQNVFSFDNTNTTPANLLNKYFILNSTNDKNSYYVWYRKDSKNLTFTNIAQGSPTTTTEFTTSFNHNLTIGDYVLITGVTGVTSTQDVNGIHLITNVTAANKFTINVNITGIVSSLVFTNAYAEPTVEDKTSCVVDILSTDTPVLIRNKTIDAVNSLSLDFNARKNVDIIETSGSGTTITIKTSGNHGFVTGDNITLSDVKNANGVSIGIDGNYVVAAGVTANSNILKIVIAAPLTSQGTSGTITSNNPWKFIVSSTSEGTVTAPDAGNIPSSVLTVTQIAVGAGEDAANKKILLSQVTSRAQAIDLTARSMVRVINQTPLNNSAVNAYYGSSANTLPGIMNFESVSLSDDPFYIMASNVSIGSSFNPDIGPVGTAISSVQRSPSDTQITSNNHGLINGDKVIIINTDIPNTTGIFTVQKINNNVFSIPVTGSSLTKTQGAWSKLSGTIVSTNETKPNRIYYSKLLQPEAVPLLNALDVGAEDQKILRIFPLRDSLFVFKEDGLYRISGETAPFVVTLFDSSCILIAPDSVSVANNIIYAWTNKGISNITESGVNEISRPIDTVVLKLASSNYKNFKSVTWGLGYDSDNSYTVYTNTAVDDEYATVGFRFSNLTNTWTNFVRSQTCGVINLKDDKIYTGSGLYNLIDQERKQFDRTDYADRDFTVDVPNTYINKDSTGHTTITLFDIDNLEDGDVVTQEQKLTVYGYNSLLAKLDYDPGISGYDFVDLTIDGGSNLREALVNLAAQLTISLPAYNYTNLIANSSGSISSVTEANPALITTASPHNLQTGRYVTISGTSALPSINNTYEVTVVNATQFTVPVNVTTGWSGAGATFTTSVNSEYANDLAACYNIIVQTLNKANSSTAFKDYKEITESQLFEAVISKIDKKNKILYLNLPVDLVVGKIQLYKAIPCEMQYAPITMGDPLLLKQIYEATMMFNNKAFTKATASFSSDLKPQFYDIDFFGQGNGIFGHYSDPGFGFGFFGGSSNAAPFRTIVPRESQRCRFMNVKYSHSVAREIWSLYGITLTATDSTSKRAYR